MILNIKNTETYFNQRVKYPNGLWNISSDGVYRTYYGNNDISYYCCCGNNAIGHMFMNNSYSNAFSVYDNGNIASSGNATASKYYVNGENYSYTVNWNGTSVSGLFVSLNGFWYTGLADLTVAISAQNVGGSYAYCWFGRVFFI